MGVYYVQKHEKGSKLLGHIWKVAGHSIRHDIRHPFYSMHTRVEVTNNIAHVRHVVNKIVTWHGSVSKCFTFLTLPWSIFMITSSLRHAKGFIATIKTLGFH
jgi:hypothetical protein